MVFDNSGGFTECLGISVGVRGLCHWHHRFQGGLHGLPAGDCGHSLQLRSGGQVADEHRLFCHPGRARRCHLGTQGTLGGQCWWLGVSGLSTLLGLGLVCSWQCYEGPYRGCHTICGNSVRGLCTGLWELALCEHSPLWWSSRHCGLLDWVARDTSDSQSPGTLVLLCDLPGGFNMFQPPFCWRSNTQKNKL